MGVIVILLGILNLLAPYVGWYMSIGWKLRDAEPSDLALAMNRISGVFMIIVGIFLL